MLFHSNALKGLAVSHQENIPGRPVYHISEKIALWLRPVISRSFLELRFWYQKCPFKRYF